MPSYSVVRWKISFGRHVDIAHLFKSPNGTTSNKTESECRASTPENPSNIIYDTLITNLRVDLDQSSQQSAARKEFVLKKIQAGDLEGLSKSALENFLGSLDFRQLRRIIGSLCHFRDEKWTVFQRLLDCLDKECTRRLLDPSDGSWDLPTSFNLLLALHKSVQSTQLSTKLFQFHQKVVTHWMEEVVDSLVLSPQQLVTYFGFLKLCRQFPKNLNRKKLEERFISKHLFLIKIIGYLL